MKSTKINRKTDVPKKQIQLDGDLDALITSAVHCEYITAQQIHPVHCSQTCLSPVPAMERPAGKHHKCPEESQSLQSPNGWALDKEGEQSSCWALPGAPPQHCAGSSAPGKQINQTTMQTIKKEQFPHNSGASSPEKKEKYL